MNYKIVNQFENKLARLFNSVMVQHDKTGALRDGRSVGMSCLAVRRRRRHTTPDYWADYCLTLEP